MRVVIAHAVPVQDVGTIALLGGLVAAGWLYGRGARGHGSVSFPGALLLLGIVFSHPVEEAAEALFSAHMAQHLVLLVPVPILVIRAKAGRRLSRGVPRPLRRLSLAARRTGLRLVPLLSLPVVGVVFALALWAWHLPALYDAAVKSGWLHLAEHGTFLGSALLLWGAVMDPRRDFLPRSMLVFGTGFHSGLLGAVLVFAPIPLYRSHLAQALVDLAPLQDQQLAGAVMWVPLGAVFLVTIGGLLIRGFERSENPADA